MTDALCADSVTVLRRRRAVVKNASFRLEYGAITAILGPNGAGKSSLLKAMLGLLPYEGNLRVDGREVRTLSPRERARQAAYVPQQTLLHAYVRVRDVVAQGRFAHASGFARVPDPYAPEVAHALADADAAHLAERGFNQLSGGEQRRVLLARALATGARVLVLDEPTAGLDVAHVLRFHALMRTLAARGCAVISALHDLRDVYHYADQALLLAAGELMLAGPAREVVSSPAAERAYGVRMTLAESAPFRLLEEPP